MYYMRVFGDCLLFLFFDLMLNKLQYGDLNMYLVCEINGI